MVATNFELKEYQRLSLERLSSYLRDTNEHGANLAFYKATNLPFRHAPAVADGTPYVCLRVPTGGGKTLLAAYAIGITARDLLQTPNPMVLWLVPSTACQRRSKIEPRGGAKLGHFVFVWDARGGRRPVSRAFDVAGG